MKHLLLFLALAGCAMPAPDSVYIGPPPTREQCVALVNEYIHKAFVDPYSVQDLTIQPPVQHYAHWYILFDSNSKNMMGGYAGLRTCKVIVDKDGKIDWPAQQIEIIHEQNQ